MAAIARKIRDECQPPNGNGKLDMLVATHRHADHISGFAGESGAIIRALEPGLVVQPWTEDPTLDPAATRPAGGGGGAHSLRALAHVAQLTEMQALAQAVLDEVPRLRATKTVPKTLVEQLSFLGDTNISNREAVENLMTMGKRRIYAGFGTRLPISSVLPGVKIDVIGPPTLAQSPRSPTRRTWTLTSSGTSRPAARAPCGRLAGAASGSSPRRRSPAAIRRRRAG